MPTNIPIDERNWPAIGDELTCVADAGCMFLTNGRKYNCVSDVIDNRVAIVDDSGEINEYLSSHFSGFKNQPLPRPINNNRWTKVVFYLITEYSDEAIVSELHHMSRRLHGSTARISLIPIHDNTKPNESH